MMQDDGRTAHLVAAAGRVTTRRAAAPEYAEAMNALRLLLLSDPACDQCDSLAGVVLAAYVDLKPDARMATSRLCPACRATLVVAGGDVS